ncbi:hypothetical protein [Paenibacillus roseipurpureus]|uniref:Uncharacterized protein n=1 Tax=Paenibacillus roseopurpureus TaxID=2918901 RepID=A0AA96LRU0_9BACL|nr:hypothetical protein [Paenibacillus sp. MBLB1832]WNR46860.1 hypothetical protein MJB10_12460 [Paenibacillus sp. MBLB1832]
MPVKELSMKFTSIYKKVRGMKRRARKLPLWGNYQKELNLESLLNRKKHYVKLWINPFYNLYQIGKDKVGKKNPPFKFRKQVLYQLIEIYLAWQEKLSQLDEPYYLKIWLGDPEFIDSQVVTALGSEIKYYEQIFINNPVPKSFPYSNLHPSFVFFTWERYVNGYYVWESDLETEEEIEDIQRRAFEVNEYVINGKQEKSYFISTGDMWLGYIR